MSTGTLHPLPTGTLRSLRGQRDAGRPVGITSVCSAHPLVIEAAVLQAVEDETDVLIEATCNQVNQEGGYTGLTPAAFRDLVHGIADGAGLARARLVLGGDHLGPNPWRHLPADDAMARAEAMIGAYADAGYAKLHLDCSMGCAGEPVALSDAVTAARAARLAARAEASAGATTAPVYVIGTEVPTPGGATEALDHLRPTRPDSVRATFDVHERAFRDVAPGAWMRVIAMVVQPGVEFGHDAVAVYRPDRAAALAATLADLPGLVFEAHSTDYQPEGALASLVRDGFPILKVGPALTFALREALYGLDAIASVLAPGRARLVDTMERVMLADPTHWRGHYAGVPDEARVLRHYSYSDRIRYYWPGGAAVEAVASMLGALGDRPVAETLVSQFLPRAFARVEAGSLVATPRAMLLDAVRDVLRRYGRAGRG